jgi:glycosyl transferase/beta-hydroxylase protein BlmF
LSTQSRTAASSTKISILCPTRERPEQVIRLIDSILVNADHPELIEILFYIDQDDFTFPNLDKFGNTVKVFQGPRTWISNAQNFLYSNCHGEIIMTAADDMVFRTVGWDTVVSATFESMPDKIALVYGNDLGTHAGKIATHGFFHRNWIETLGTWVQPGRGSLWDLWSTENARILGRLIFLEDLIIEHVHYRQSKVGADFDNTYSFVRSMNSSFRPEVTYKKLERERRIDRILLAEQMGSPPKWELKYLLGSFVCDHVIKNSSLEKKRRVQSVTNIGLFGLALRYMWTKVKLK